ncbi:MAG: class I SAM-dependent methyltransferase [Mariprofundaceae bacterium]
MHSPISRQRWQKAQQRVLDHWRHQPLGDARERLKARWLPWIERAAEGLGDDARILELQSGPVCLTQFLPFGEKTWQDTLIEDWRRMFPGELPEGRHLVHPPESLPLPDGHFDLVVCLDGLTLTWNPEMALHEAARVLKPGGRFLLGIEIHPPLEARLRYFAEHWLPALCRGPRPYAYTMRGIRHTLARHFTTRHAELVEVSRGWLPWLKREEHVFLCEKPDAA